MKKVYKIIPTEEPHQYILYQDDTLIFTGESSAVHTRLYQRLHRTISAIEQHGGSPQVDTQVDEHGVERFIVTWEGGSKTEMRCIGLPAEAWLNLEELAEATDSIAKTGRNVGQPSWRALIRRIADGDLIIRPRQDAGKK